MARNKSNDSSNETFVADRMSELMAAKETGDTQALVGAFASAFSESTGSVSERLERMTAAVEDAKRKR